MFGEETRKKIFSERIVERKRGKDLAERNFSRKREKKIFFYAIFVEETRKILFSAQFFENKQKIKLGQFLTFQKIIEKGDLRNFMRLGTHFSDAKFSNKLKNLLIRKF